MWGRNGSSNGAALIDRSGRVVLSGRQVKEGYSYFSDGLMTMPDAEKLVGFVDKQFQWVIGPKYTDARAFSEERAAVQIGGQWGFIDKTGRIVVPATYDLALPFSNGMALVRGGAESLFGFVDRAGREVMPPQFAFATAFNDDRSLVRLPGGRLTIIDRIGNSIDQLEADAASEFSEGLASVRVKGLSGYVDRSGTWAIAPRFTTADSFWRGLARVTWKGGPGYIDRTGRTVWTSE